MEKTTKDESKKEKCIHAGHRQRLLDSATKAGLENMSDVQVVELLLTTVFPRGDVNPLAHRLLDEFGNFYSIIEAEPRSLMRVKGINERSARTIHLFQEFFFYYAESKMRKKKVVKNLSEVIDVIEDLIRFRTTENIILLALSAGSIITHKRRIDRGSVTTVSLSVMDIADFVAVSKPVSLVVAHCHPYGNAIPSESDYQSFKAIDDFCRNCGVNFVDSIIVGENGVFSHRKERMIRSYYDIDEIKESFVGLK